MQLEMIAAVGARLELGLNGTMPWHLPEDLKHFKAVTMGLTLVMGRRTLESIGRALPGRLNLVISRDTRLADKYPGVKVVPSLDEAIKTAGGDRLMVIGGAMLYAAALKDAQILHLTRILGQFEADTFFPAWQQEDFVLTGSTGLMHSASTGLDYVFETWHRPGA